MIAVKLLTRDGGFVVTVQVPPFNPFPKGIHWGARTFFYVNDTEYREDLLYVVPVLPQPDTIIQKHSSEEKHGG